MCMKTLLFSVIVLQCLSERQKLYLYSHGQQAQLQHLVSAAGGKKELIRKFIIGKIVSEFAYPEIMPER